MLEVLGFPGTSHCLKFGKRCPESPHPSKRFIIGFTGVRLSAPKAIADRGSSIVLSLRFRIPSGPTGRNLDAARRCAARNVGWRVGRLEATVLFRATRLV